MANSLLQKDFTEKDLQRARNIISGKYENNTQVSVGYEKIEEVEHKEGDIWVEDGKEWIMEDGVKVSLSKLQKARELVKIPLVCPKCGKAMSSRYDKKMYTIHGMCLDCVTKFEDDLRRLGMYHQYEREMMSGNIEGFVVDLKARIKSLNKNLDVREVTGEGEVEDWGRLSTDLTNNLTEWADLLLEKIK